MSFKENFTRALRNKNYRLFFYLQLLSFVGTWIQVTATSWLVYRLTESAFLLGTVGFASTIPALFLAPIAGVVADNFNRKYILIVTQTMCLIQAIILAILYFTGDIDIWHIIFLSIFMGIANGFDMTARQSFVPFLINKRDLPNAIALNSSIFNGARMLGPAIAGYLIVTFGEGICFLINALSYAPIIVFLIVVKTRKQEIKKIGSPFEDFKNGVKYSWGNKPIRVLLLLVGTFSLLGAPFVTLLPIISAEILQRGADGLGLLTGSGGIGAVCAAIFLASRKRVIGIKKIIAICVLTGSSALFTFAFCKAFYISCLLLVIIGFSFVIIFAGSNTLLQSMSPEEYRGRIMSLFSVMLMGIYPLGSVLIGLLAQGFGVCLSISCCAFILFIIGIYFDLKVPALTWEAKNLLIEQMKAEGLFTKLNIKG